MGTAIRPEISSKSKYWISRHRYYELKHFCLQYPEWKANYIRIDGMTNKPMNENGLIDDSTISDPTSKSAEIRIEYRNRIEMVEKAAYQAGGDLYLILVSAVTEGLSYETVSPPCCKEVWYTIYRRFFWILDKLRK